MAFQGKYQITLNYPTSSSNEPRWGFDKPPHPQLYAILDQRREQYGELLRKFLPFKEHFLAISKDENRTHALEPHLSNPWLPVLDSLALYCLLGFYRPSTYLEVGSGNSTLFARRSIRDNALATKIVSIDPEPRAEIDQTCDELLRKPVEVFDPLYFDRLGRGDFLFIDNSHRCFMNSDATAVFLDIIPRLAPGVVVQVHDIWLPNDYPKAWADRYYSEQYLLAAYLLAGCQRFDVLLPNAFITLDKPLMCILDPILTDRRMEGVKRGGGSFWFVMR
jgi:hypothetical protein